MPPASSTHPVYDPTGRLTSTQLRSNDHSVINLHGYAYNAAHQRTVGTRTNVSVVGGSYSRRTGYSYDDAGQLTVAWATNSAGSLVSAESRGYAYDLAQNLARRTNNAAGSTVTATVNALNQLTAGLGFSGSLVYDRRGNLLSIGSAGSGKAFAYDHENQCVSAGGFNAYNKSDFVYDGKGRLRKRTDYTWNGSSWSYQSETRYVYDGMLLIQERTSANHPAVTYTRGVDLSGSLTGAGGIGGLLARTAHSVSSPYQPSTHAYYHADGNGNVTYLLRQDRTHGASYKYDSYGRLIASSGPLSSANLMRFSSKPWHDHSETYYYGYRFYLPEGQRWINRDPLGDRGFQENKYSMTQRNWKQFNRPSEILEGANLYAFVKNDTIDQTDPFGLSSFRNAPPPCAPYPECLQRDPSVGCWSYGWEAQRRQFPGARDPYGGAYRHCVAACCLKRRWGFIGSVVIFIWDTTQETTSENSREDMLGERRGVNVACNSGSCESECRKFYP